MGRKLRLLTVIALAIAGIGVMAYPSLSNYINTLHGSRAVQALTEQVECADASTLEEQRRLAEEYNAALSGAGEPTEAYEHILDFGNGIMGSLRIPKIDLELAIYHGVSDAVLRRGVGHMPGSAFPIGGAGNHSVLTGHTGLPSAELFTRLTELAEGDRFCITILGRELIYEVDQITVVEPQEVEALGAERGRDYCTLVTCTPYGINSHRLLVRGERVQTADTGTLAQADAADSGPKLPPELLAAGISVAALLILAAVILLRRAPGEQEGGT